MASDSTQTDSHGNMVAQPVNPIQAALASRDTMSPGGSLAKEATDGTISEDFLLSEDSPAKEEKIPSRNQSLSINRYRTPRSSPSPSRSKSTRATRPLSRHIPVKRSASTMPTSSIPMIPRRGRVAISDEELWGVTGRLVHRKVDVPAAEAGTVNVIPLIEQQFMEDRAATTQLYAAVQALARAVNVHDGDLKDVNRRLDEQAKLRFDDNKLHNGTMAYLRSGVEESKAVVTEQGREMFETLAKRLDVAIPELIETKLVAVKTSLDELEATEKIMKDYLQELSAQRPEEGKMVFSAFQSLREEVEAIKMTQQQQAAATANLSSATAAGLNGIVPNGTGSGLSAEHISMLDSMKATLEGLVASEQPRPCHCPDVTSNIARIAYLEVQLASMQAAASGSPSCSVATTFPAAGAGSSSTDGLPPFVRRSAGGNGACHCRCVEQLLVRVQALEVGRATTRDTSQPREPLMPHMRQAPPGLPGSEANAARININGPLKLTLPLGQLASERRDKSVYDDKLMTQAEYRYDGGKSGNNWKSKVERYFITKIPVAMELLQWAEAHNLEAITEDKFVSAAQPYLTEEQCQTFNREVWGFLSGCLSGQAEVHFKRAPMLNGLDAWRRVIRIIEDTLPMKFEQLRRAVQMIHVKPIKDLESIPDGIAQFETTLEEYEKA